MNISYGCNPCFYLFCILVLSSFIIHLSTLFHHNIGEVDSRSRIRIPPGGCVLIFQFYLIFFKYNHKLSLHILKTEYSSLLHCVIQCRPEKHFYVWLSSNTPRSDDHHRISGPCCNELNRCKCVFYNLFDEF